jgi:uncharacterized protein YaiI (UPF0178 family)
MQIWIDGDGCPVVNITIQEAKKRALPVTVVKNFAVQVKDDYANVVTVDISRDAADFYIVNHIKAGDLVISQDYGLCAMVLSKKGLCLNQNGRIITKDNIDMILDTRHHARVERQKNKKYTKFKKRDKEQDEAYLQVLQSILNGTK